MPSTRQLPSLFYAGLILVMATATVAKPPENKSADELYLQGKELYDQKKYDEAFPYLLKAAQMGHSDAQMHVGKMYYNGWGVKHDHKKGEEWHKKAAAQGNAESIQKLKKMKH